MVLVVTVEASAGTMRNRKNGNHNNLRGGRLSKCNDTVSSRNVSITEKKHHTDSQDLSCQPIHSGADVPKNPMLAVAVALAAVLLVLLGGGPDNGIPDGTNSTISLSQATNETFGFSPKPRIVYMTFGSNKFVTNRHASSIPKKRYQYIDRTVDSLSDSDNEVHLSDSEEYGKKPEPRYTKDPPCEPQYEWQDQNLQVCNVVHELDMTAFLVAPVTAPAPAPAPATHNAGNDVADSTELFRFIASGGYRDVYMIRDHNSNRGKLALKTLKWSRDFTERHFDRHRRDAIVADRLTALPSSVDIFGFCGQSAIYEFAKGGDLRRAIQKRVSNPRTAELAWTSTEKLRIAYQVAAALADVHNVDMEGRASIAHTDISTGQFISIEGDDNFKINDFNRARLLKKNSVNNTVCPFHVKSNKGKFRSPEEYLYHAETEKIDVYSMGNIFWVLLHGTYPFEKMSRKATKRAVSKGQRPTFDASLATSDDIYIQALITAAKMCWTQDPEKRASAREVQYFIQSKLREK